MDWKRAPYIVMLVFSLIVTVIRIFMIREWSIPVHILLFFSQVLLLAGIWELVKGLGNGFEKRLPFNINPGKRMIVQIACSVVIVAPVMVGVSFILRPHLPAFVTDQFVIIIIILFVVFTVLLNFMLAAFYFFTQWQESVQEKAQWQIRAAEMEKERSRMQYHHLKNQVNPHFLFNTFTSLDGLVQTNPELASDFIRHLSKVYRYVLEHKEREVVSLQTELDFIDHYLSLLRIRYQASLDISMQISIAARERGIVMVTLQMLIDNAIKHNSLGPEEPLIIRIWDQDGYLHILNPKQLRKQIETSNKQGLDQLKELYQFLDQRPISIHDDKDNFEVKLPLL